MALFLRPLDAACAGAGAGATFLLEPQYPVSGASLESHLRFCQHIAGSAGRELDALGALGLDGTIPNSMPDPDALGLGVVPTSPSCKQRRPYND